MTSSTYICCMLLLASILGLGKAQLSCSENEAPTGYCYIQFYAETGCSGDLLYAEGSATGVCVSQSNAYMADAKYVQQNPFFNSFKQFYNASNPWVTVQTYSGDLCNGTYEQHYYALDNCINHYSGSTNLTYGKSLKAICTNEVDTEIETGLIVPSLSFGSVIESGFCQACQSEVGTYSFRAYSVEETSSYCYPNEAGIVYYNSSFYNSTNHKYDAYTCNMEREPHRITYANEKYCVANHTSRVKGNYDLRDTYLQPGCFLPTGQPSKQPSSQPSTQPSSRPSRQPSSNPTSPTGQPSLQPSGQPSKQPSIQPTSQPSVQPTTQPTRRPSSQPSSQPTHQPTTQPSRQPSSNPTKPTGQPSKRPSAQPSVQPTSQPSLQPSSRPSSQPTKQPNSKPSTQPTRQPSSKPSRPSSQPSKQPSAQPSRRPSTQPTTQPSTQPTTQPSTQPTTQPSRQPSSNPTNPSGQPSTQPSAQPSRQPTSQPTLQPTSQPSNRPTTQPSSQPTTQPSRQPSSNPTNPSGQPSTQPSGQPTRRPSTQPTKQPLSRPSTQPTSQPSTQPSRQPSSNPTKPSGQPSTQPSAKPSRQPSSQPSVQPTTQPSTHPTTQPTIQPTSQPTKQPSGRPSRQPSAQPSTQPSNQPTSFPTMVPYHLFEYRLCSGCTNYYCSAVLPTSQPTNQPSGQPSVMPTRQPTSRPSIQPTNQPSSRPSRQPTSQPSTQPSIQPTSMPSTQPTIQPTTQPSRQPTSLPTTRPTKAPTPRPTTGGVPTKAPITGVSNTVSVTQTFSNISKSSYNETRVVNGIKIAVADTMRNYGVSVADVKNVQVTLYNSTSRRNLLAVSYYLAAYYEISTQTYNASAFGGFVYSSVVSTSFVNMLGTQTGIPEIVVAGITVNQPTFYPTKSPSHSYDTLNDGQIAGVVIGCFVAAAIIIAAIMYVFMRPSSASNPNEGEAFETRV